MEVSKIYSKKILWIMIVLGVIIGAAVNAGIYYGMDWFLEKFGNGITEKAAAEDFSWLVRQIGLLSQSFYQLVVPIVVSSVLIASLIVWLILKNSISGIFDQLQVETGDNKDRGKKKKDFIDQKIAQDRKRRLFLHSLSFLQREGRLLDFFEEDLSLYDDEQIGAAVRSIQEDCKKAVKKYIDPQPVLKNEEGDAVSIEEGFDIDAIKLVGNVSGTPPFEGILKHRGWKAGKKEIPKLSDIQDAAIIIPAEVEIQ